MLTLVIVIALRLLAAVLDYAADRIDRRGRPRLRRGLRCASVALDVVALLLEVVEV